MHHPSYDANGSPLDTPISNGAECATGEYLKLQATIEREPEHKPDATYGTMHVAVTDDLIAALEHLTQQPWPTDVDRELLCLKVQALIMRERAKRVQA
jgi:hypothetical protein